MGPQGHGAFAYSAWGGGDASVNFLKKAQISEDANNLIEGLKVRRLSGTAGADIEAQSRHSRGRCAAPLGAVERGWWSKAQRDISLSSLLSHLETGTEKGASASWYSVWSTLAFVKCWPALTPVPPVEFILLFLILFLLKW